MQRQKDSEPNFIEKRRQWTGGMEPALNRRLLVMMLPAIMLSVFVVMAAPYLVTLMKELVKPPEKTMIHASVTTEEVEQPKVAEPEIPPDPEARMREYYRAQADAQGIDWRNPQIPALEPDYAEDVAIEARLPEVEMPATSTELEARSRGSE